MPPKNAAPAPAAGWRQRLQQAQQRLEQALAPSPAQAQALLAARAQRAALAARHQAPRPTRYLTFRLATTRCALEVTYVREVCHYQAPAPLPGVPPYVLGLAAVRGELLAVFDLAQLLALEATPSQEPPYLLVVGPHGAPFGCPAWEV